MPVQRLKDFLETNRIPYEIIPHPVAFTAQGVAALAHVPGREMAKTVLVRVDDTFAMAVLAASQHVDTALLRMQIGANEVRLADEEEFAPLFPDCELGAMPPFGNLYGVPVFVDAALAKDDQIAFNAGSHKEIIRMRLDDFVAAVNATVIGFAAVPALAGGWDWR